MTRTTTRRTTALAAVTALAMLGSGLSAQGAPGASAPTPGARGIGDRLYPALGNGGYDAQHYDLDLRYATSAPSQPIDGTMTMTARSTQALSRFDLDFRGTGLGSVTVDGAPATFLRNGGELVIRPARPIADGATFVVQVKDFTSAPTVANEADVASTVFFQTAEGSAVAGQPNLMNVVYPSNDHPSDKATFSFRLDVPAGETAVANGVLTGRQTRADRTIWTYEERQPMATELTQLVVGKYSVIDRGTVDGVQVRDVVPTNERAYYTKALAVETGQLRWMIARAGRYPFPLYGTLVVTADIGFALETQTLSLFDTTWWTGEPRGVWAPSMTHELAHQWYGDSVSPAQWSDIWLNEGHASWYEFLWAAPAGLPLRRHRVHRAEPRCLDEAGLRPGRPLAGQRRTGCLAAQPGQAVQQQRLLRRRTRPVCPAPEDRYDGLRAAGARLGPEQRRTVPVDRRLHRVCLDVVGPGPDGLPAGVALRQQHADDAGASRLDGEAGRLRLAFGWGWVSGGFGWAPGSCSGRVLLAARVLLPAGFWPVRFALLSGMTCRHPTPKIVAIQRDSATCRG